MKFLNNSIKVTFLLFSFLFLTGCSKEEVNDETVANIEGVWQLGRTYGTSTFNGFSANLDGASEGTFEFRNDGSYENNVISGSITISIPALNYSETTSIEASFSSGTYLYDESTDDLVVDGEVSKVVVLNANFMKVKTLINDSGTTGEIFTEFHR